MSTTEQRAREWRDRYELRTREAAEKHDYENYRMTAEVVHVLDMVLMWPGPIINERIPFKFKWEVEAAEVKA